MAITPNKNTIVVLEDPALVNKLVVKQPVLVPGEDRARPGSTGETVIPTAEIDSDGQQVFTKTTATEQNNNVYLTNININEEQNFITSVSGAALCVGTVDGSNVYTNVTTNVNKLGFDTDSGFDVTDLGSGLAKIAMNSTFKYWNVNGNSGLIACGIDTMNFVAGSNITITSDNTTVPKTLTISATGGGGGGSPGGSNLQVQYNNNGNFGGATGLTYCNTTGAVGMNCINVPLDTNLSLTVNHSDTYWYVTYGDFPDLKLESASQNVFDSQGNIYLVGSDDYPSTEPFLTKFDPSGNILWQKKFTEVNNDAKAGSVVTVDSLDNVYCSIWSDDSSVNSIFKFDSSGNLIWGKDISTTPSLLVLDMAVDSNFNVILVGSYDNFNDSGIVKLDSTGNILWQKVYQDNNSDANAVLLTATNEIVIATRSESQVNPNLVKFDVNGSVLWQKEYLKVGVTTPNGPTDIATDSAGNLYFSATTAYNDDTSYDLYVIKTDSAGDLIWQVNLTRAASSDQSNGIVIDDSGNVYITGMTDKTVWRPDKDLFIVKLDTNGNVLWQRQFGSDDLDEQWFSWTRKNIDVYENVYAISGYSVTADLNGSAILVKLPTDGSLTGVYGVYNYQAINFTIDNTEYTTTVTTTTVADATLTIGPTTMVISANTYTRSYFKIAGGTSTFNYNSVGQLQTPNYALPIYAGNAKNVLCVASDNSLSWGTANVNLNSRCSFRVGFTKSNHDIIGSGNIALGHNAFDLNHGGSPSCNNVAVGYGSARILAMGAYNVMLGNQTMYCASGGNNNFAGGTNALYCNCNGNNNIALGQDSMNTNWWGSQNIALGTYSLYSNCNACNNIAIGQCSLYSNVGGIHNVAIGGASLKCNTAGNFNIGIGCKALNNNTTGVYNVAIGYGADQYNSTGSYNVSIGWCAGGGGESNLSLGVWAASSNRTCSVQKNIFMGYQVAGVSAFCDNSCDNIIMGTSTGIAQQGDGNIYLGNNAASGTGTSNLCNIAIGVCAGAGSLCGVCNNIYIGTSVACSAQGSGNVYIGANAGFACCTGCTLQITTGNPGESQTRLLVNNYGLYHNIYLPSSMYATTSRHIYASGTWTTSVERVISPTSSELELNLNLGSTQEIFYPASDFTLQLIGNFAWPPMGGNDSLTEIKLYIYQNSTPRIMSGLSIKTTSMPAFESQTVRWLNGVIPSGTANKLNVITIHLFGSEEKTVTAKLESYG